MALSRITSTGCVLLLAALLAACSTAPPLPHSLPPLIGQGFYEEKLGITEPAPTEVVVVINNNIKMVHAGMFAGATLLDPAGSYLLTRRQQKDWPGVSLHDYVRFQLEDGPEVMVYRFRLPPEPFAEIQSRVGHAGSTMVLFCAAKVQSIISGVPPFEGVPSAWLISPVTVSRHLDLLIQNNPQAGACYWPDGSSCYSGQ
jgi:hypothetical protein